MIETEYFQGRSVDEPKRYTIFPPILWAAVLGIILGALLYSSKAIAAPVFQTIGEGVTVTLYDEPCALDIQLQFRATWQEKGKTFEGCWGPRPDAGVILAYFDDKSIGLIPMQAFKRVTGV